MCLSDLAAFTQRHPYKTAVNISSQFKFALPAKGTVIKKSEYRLIRKAKYIHYRAKEREKILVSVLSIH